MRFFVHYFEKAWSELLMNANSCRDDSVSQVSVSEFSSWFPDSFS
jgi:hypothetical protein